MKYFPVTLEQLWHIHKQQTARPVSEKQTVVFSSPSKSRLMQCGREETMMSAKKNEVVLIFLSTTAKIGNAKSCTTVAISRTVGATMLLFVNLGLVLTK